VGHESGVGAVGLFAEADSAAPGVAKRPDKDRGEQGRIDFVPHGVGHRHVERVALQGEVERVSADVAGRLEPTRERELPCLARV
jgi:hypothetical protein